MASTLGLILLVPAPFWPWEERGWGEKEGFLGSANVWALTLSLLLYVPALQSTTKNCSSSISNLATQTLDFLRTAERNPYSRFRLLQNQLLEAWRRRASLLENGCPSLWENVWLRRWKPLEN